MNFFDNVMNSNNGTPFSRMPGDFIVNPDNNNNNTNTNTNENISGNNNNDENNITHSSPLKDFCFKILQLPFFLLYYIFVTIFNLINLVKPFNRLLNFYSKMNNKPTDDFLLIETNHPQYDSLYNATDGTLTSFVFRGNYTELLEACTNQFKFGLIYLHDPLLDDTTAFIDTILVNEVFAGLVKKYQLLIWFGDVTTSEGLQVVNSMKVREFPFLGLLCLNTDKIIELKFRVENNSNLNPLPLNILENVLSKNNPFLQQLRQEKKNLDVQRFIKAQQDLRYNESLRRDRERDQQRNISLLRKKWLLWKKSTLAVKPSSNEEFCKIAIKFPTGERLIKKFNPDLSIEEVYIFVDLKESGLLDNSEEFVGDISIFENFVYDFKFKLFTTNPRIELLPTTIIRNESNLYPNGNIIVEAQDN